eukprot:9981-Heterococcus_DN1.PRE.2
MQPVLDVNSSSSAFCCPAHRNPSLSSTGSANSRHCGFVHSNSGLQQAGFEVFDAVFATVLGTEA